LFLIAEIENPKKGHLKGKGNQWRMLELLWFLCLKRQVIYILTVYISCSTLSTILDKLRFNNPCNLTHIIRVTVTRGVHLPDLVECINEIRNTSLY
jgi:hypothetical protein